MFKVYKAEVENQLGKKIKIIRSDRGGEYFSNEFIVFCEDHGIMNALHHVHLNKMVWLNEKIGLFLK